MARQGYFAVFAYLFLYPPLITVVYIGAFLDLVRHQGARVVIRRVSARLYVTAATFVLVVISTGSLLAVLINVRRANRLESQWRRDRDEWQRLQFSYSELLHQFSTENCVAARVVFLDSVENLTAVQQKLDRYLASPFGEANRRFNEFKREHAISALAHWSIAVKLRKTCAASLLPILYLYSAKSCAQCFFQTRILLFMERRNRPNVLVFLVDVDFASPEQVGKLKELYAVTALPASIIGETKLRRFFVQGQAADHSRGKSSVSPDSPAD